MRGSILGIEIGHAHIKLMEMVQKSGRKRIIRHSIVSTPLQSIENGVIKDIESICLVIGNELKKKRYRARKAVCVVQSSLIVNRQVKMEQYSVKTMKQLLEIRAEDFLPVQGNDYEIDFEVLGEINEEGKIRNKVLIVAAPQMVISPVLEVLKRLRLVPVRITVPSEGISYLAGKENQLEENILVIDLGEQITNLTAIYHRKEYLCKIIEFNLGELLKDIKTSEEKESKGAVFNNKLLPQLEYRIISEVERFLQYFYSQYESELISKVCLIGGGSGVEEIRSYVADVLSMPLGQLSYLDKVDNELAEDEYLFMNILGAVLAV